MTKWLAFGMTGVALTVTACGQMVRANGRRLEIQETWGTVEVYAVAPDVLRINTHPTGVKPKPTEMMDRKGLRNARAIGSSRDSQIKTSGIVATVTKEEGNHPGTIHISNLSGGASVWIDRAELQAGVLHLSHLTQENLYGMRGSALFGARDPRLALAKGLLRNDGALVAAGSQGDGGAPLAYTTKWGVLVDSIDGRFDATSNDLTFSHGSRKDLEAYIVIGPPKRTIEVANALTGHPPMPPKWSLGFMNSQWGTDEKMVLDIVDKYRKKRIPLDAFIFDFDFKAWGEDNYGEWRWNSTNNPGNVGGNKFPDGQSGLFGKQMLDRGVRMVGIMKPRVLTQNSDLKPTKAAAEATAHNWWMAKKPYQDYFSHRLANDFDFSKPDLRKWYWERSKNMFDTGIAGWWNDEADDGFDSLGFFHMQESLFEGQESVSNQRVWSLNRNYYLGAQRFAFGTWSGDIRTGFQVMADQRTRMLLLTDIGQSHWSMDTGGFNGHPDPENYARWMEFAAVVPIMRVHGTFGQRRQPWEYGPIAEAAAKSAIRWRYEMLPSFYSWEHEASNTGIGIVRPLFWEFPENPRCANTVDSWMLGEQLLVSPVVVKGQSTKQISLPEGRWFSTSTGQGYDGGTTVVIPCDSSNWSDMPMFVRSGSILATQPVQQYSGELTIDTLTLDVWPDKQRLAMFEVYDDDGVTRNNERGEFFSQPVLAKWATGSVVMDLSEPKGSYRSSATTYRIRVHVPSVTSVKWNGTSIPFSKNSGVCTVEIPAGKAGQLQVRP